MPIIVGIDGTGDGDDAAYAKDFEHSFVRRICPEGKINTKYYRGPNAVGYGLSAAVTGGLQFIETARRTYPNEKILLTGYSRGACGAVVIAKKLKKLDIKVEALLLFDCVDRQINMDASVIPDNVGFVQHVIRNPAARSRMSFGNDGLRYYPPTSFPTATQFMCTHGGMGGTPWSAEKAGKSPTDFVDEGYGEGAINWGLVGGMFYTTRVTYEQDARVSAHVWRFVQPFIRTYNFM